MPNRGYEGETNFQMIGLHTSKKLKINMDKLKENKCHYMDSGRRGTNPRF